MDTSGFDTTTGAVTEIAVFWLDVALTENDPAVDPAVKRPPVVIEPPVQVQVTGGFAVVEPSVFWPATENCCVFPATREAEVGEIANEAKVGPATVTVPETVAILDRVLNESLIWSVTTSDSATEGVNVLI